VAKRNFVHSQKQLGGFLEITASAIKQTEREEEGRARLVPSFTDYRANRTMSHNKTL
jgi:hypothetical protein